MFRDCYDNNKLKVSCFFALLMSLWPTQVFCKVPTASSKYGAPLPPASTFLMSPPALCLPAAYRHRSLVLTYFYLNIHHAAAWQAIAEKCQHVWLLMMRIWNRILLFIIRVDPSG